MLNYTKSSDLCSREWSMQLRDAAEVLGVHYQTAYAWVRQGLLPARKTGRGYDVSESDVSALVARRAAAADPGARLGRPGGPAVRGGHGRGRDPGPARLRPARPRRAAGRAVRAGHRARAAAR